MWMLIAAVAALVAGGWYGKSHGWFGDSQPLVIDLEADMPATLQQTILAQIATQTDPAQLQALAVTMDQANYIQAAYALRYRAWQISGSQGTPPTQPTAAAIVMATAARAASGAPPAPQTYTIAPSGSPQDLTANVGDTIAVANVLPYGDPATGGSPNGYKMSGTPGCAFPTGPSTLFLAGPGTLMITGGGLNVTVQINGSATGVAATGPTGSVHGPGLPPPGHTVTPFPPAGHIVGPGLPPPVQNWLPPTVGPGLAPPGGTEGARQAVNAAMGRSGENQHR